VGKRAVREGGPHRLYSINTGDDVATLAKKLKAGGIEFSRIELSNSGATAFVLDQDGSLGTAIGNLTKENNYEVRHTQGTGEFIGSWDTREEGHAIYKGIIDEDDKAHGTRAQQGRDGLSGRTRGADLLAQSRGEDAAVGWKESEHERKNNGEFGSGNVATKGKAQTKTGTRSAQGRRLRLLLRRRYTALTKLRRTRSTPSINVSSLDRLWTQLRVTPSRRPGASVKAS